MSISNGFTTKWKEQLIKLIINKKVKFEEEPTQNNSLGIHLAIFNEPFLSLLFEGKKTIESRFSINRSGPYQKVRAGDIIFIKKSGGPVCGYFLAGNVSYFLSNKKIIEEIRTKYSNEICAGSVKRFWEERKNAKFITLIEVNTVKMIDPIFIEKKDRTAWVIIRNSDSYPTLPV